MTRGTNIVGITAGTKGDTKGRKRRQKKGVTRKDKILKRHTVGIKESITGRRGKLGTRRLQGTVVQKTRSQGEREETKDEKKKNCRHSDSSLNSYSTSNGMET